MLLFGKLKEVRRRRNPWFIIYLREKHIHQLPKEVCTLTWHLLSLSCFLICRHLNRTSVINLGVFLYFGSRKIKQVPLQKKKVVFVFVYI